MHGFLADFFRHYSFNIHKCLTGFDGVITGMLKIHRNFFLDPTRTGAEQCYPVGHENRLINIMGDKQHRSQILPASTVFQQTGLKVPPLGAKDGLSFVNGTPCMTGLGCLALADAVNLAEWADVIGAMSFEALRGQMDAFDESVLRLKPYPGIQIVGQHLRQLLAGSQIIAKSQGVRTQDAMSIRSIPQIHGACRDVITQAEQQFNTELASATDNPLIMGTPNHYRIISQSNPHGESIDEDRWLAPDVCAVSKIVRNTYCFNMEN